MNNDNIGIDPSVIETIEVLEPEKKNNNSKRNNKKQSNGLIKKILFTILVIGIMAGVGYLVYYYLNLGTKNANKIDPSVELKDIAIFEGDMLSNDVNYYGIFTNIDSSTCTLNINDVNTYIAGEYPYTITCGSLLKEGKIIVNKFTNVKTKMINKVVGDDISPNEFVEVSDGNVSFVNENDVKNLMATSGGPYEVQLLVDNMEYTGLLLVYDKKIWTYFECYDANSESKVYDRFTFGSDFTTMGNYIRITKNVFKSQEEYNAFKYSLDNELYLIDNKNYAIDVVEVISKEELDSNYGSVFPNTYDLVINEYYKGQKGYTCKFNL